jgi:hypothetical protein
MIERDPTINKLQQDVFAKMAEISKPEPGTEKPHQENIKLITPDEAMKELLDLNQIVSNT